MYLYGTPRIAGTGRRRTSGVPALLGIGSYSFGAADDTVVAPVVEDTIVVDVAPQTPEAVTTPTTTVVDTVPPQIEPLPTLTAAEIDQKQFGYFGSMSAAVGVQAMTMSAGAALAIAGAIIGYKFKNSTRVSTREVILSTAIAAGTAFLAIFAIRTFR
jgi:hypothetical protein